MTDDFVSLHQHSHASLLDGLGAVEDLLRQAITLGQPAIALTDHGNVAGLYSGWREAKRLAAEFEQPFKFCLASKSI